MKRTTISSFFLGATSAIVLNVTFAQSSAMDGMDMKAMGNKSMDMNATKAKDDAKPQKGNPKLHTGRGIITNVSMNDGIVTFSHEPIKSLNWPAMTMGFKVKDRALLNKIKPGDKVQFTLMQSGSEYVITNIQ